MAKSRNNALEFSSAGSRILAGSASSPAGEKYGAIQCLKDSTISAVTTTNVQGDSSLLDTFGAGTIIYGNFTAVSISGTDSLVALHKV